ncbi:MAG: DNA repair protein RecO [Coriobacteriales bacterium]|jgi:DNA repair protein RecO (recombination protein O)|nr:DNA repair protein RecO [Coriobacteriales bacterium]
MAKAPDAAMPSYRAQIIVLRKTRLGETDLIITGFSGEGRQVRAVAKGARKPGSKLGVHLELYSITHVLLHKGRNLDIITEASGVVSNRDCRADVLHSAGAAVIVEMLDRVSADGDGEARLFPLASEALRCVGTVPDEGVALITAAAVLKMSAQLGFRPSLTQCVYCGDDVVAVLKGDADAAIETVPGDTLGFSFEQGGVICDTCLSELTENSYRHRDAQLIRWAEVLITSKFVDLECYGDEEHAGLGRALLDFAREWLRFHLVNRLKSLDFLLSFTRG